MPSAAASTHRADADDRRRTQIDIVLGDCHGISCHPDVMAAAEACLRDLGYRVRRNSPYAGGFVTRHYGRPRVGVHALQIELNRALYMDERKVERHDGMTKLAEDMATLVARLGTIAPQPNLGLPESGSLRHLKPGPSGPVLRPRHRVTFAWHIGCFYLPRRRYPNVRTFIERPVPQQSPAGVLAAHHRWREPSSQAARRDRGGDGPDDRGEPSGDFSHCRRCHALERHPFTG